MEALLTIDESSPSGLLWKVSGLYAGCLAKHGYWVVRVKGKNYYAHRLVWLLHNGGWPEHQLDHIDGNRANNALSNLRLCPEGQLDNNQNRAKSKNNKSGYTGVCWATKRGAWQAQIKVAKKIKWLGYFASAEKAYEAYCSAKAEHHKFNPIQR